MSLQVEPLSLPTQQKHGETVFPYIFSCQSDDATLAETTEWLASQRDELLDLAHQHGAVLFRGFPFETAEDFDAFIASFDLPNFPYKESLSNAVRVNRTERVFSANEAPPDVHILFHHEMAQTPMFPTTIFFFCEIAPQEGGATPICRSDVLYEKLSKECPEFAHNCETKGLKYSNVMPGEDDAQSGMGRSWKSTLRVETKEEAESRLLELGYSWEWQADGSLRATTPVLPCVREVSPGRKVFFNQLIAAFCGWKDARNDPAEAIRHGDDSKLDRDAVMRAVELADELTFDVEWQAGDAVLCDNTLIMHGRKPFKGTRKVLASLADKQTHAFEATA
ncbi:MAG: TauD/TfdA family dioxygenase [Planctomycetaceae bacterium]|nr:TauD/TfdA family dioxygenase [Planctomycetaceae bacterium]